MLGLVGCFAPEQPPSSGKTEQFELEAKAVAETYKLLVRLPEEYEQQPDRAFPVLIQLDAELGILEEFKVAAGFASTLEREGALSPCIVVGISYRTKAEADFKRFRDLGLPLEDPTFRKIAAGYPDGEGQNFYAFLRDELMPELSRRYRLAGPEHRALSGHSLGGYFTMYALTRHGEAPVFGHYLAASPSIFWDGATILGRWAQFRDPSTRAVLFTTAGQLEGPEMVTYFDEWVARIDAAGFTHLDAQARKLQTDHPGTVAPSIRDGLRSLSARGFGRQP